MASTLGKALAGFAAGFADARNKTQILPQLLSNLQQERDEEKRTAGLAAVIKSLPEEVQVALGPNAAGITPENASILIKNAEAEVEVNRQGAQAQRFFQEDPAARAWIAGRGDNTAEFSARNWADAQNDYGVHQEGRARFYRDLSELQEDISGTYTRSAGLGQAENAAVTAAAQARIKDFKERHPEAATDPAFTLFQVGEVSAAKTAQRGAVGVDIERGLTSPDTTQRREALDLASRMGVDSPRGATMRVTMNEALAARAAAEAAGVDISSLPIPALWKTALQEVQPGSLSTQTDSVLLLTDNRFDPQTVHEAIKAGQLQLQTDELARGLVQATGGIQPTPEGLTPAAPAGGTAPALANMLWPQTSAEFQGLIGKNLTPVEFQAAVAQVISRTFPADLDAGFHAIGEGKTSFSDFLDGYVNLQASLSTLGKDVGPVVESMNALFLNRVSGRIDSDELFERFQAPSLRPDSPQIAAMVSAVLGGASATEADLGNDLAIVVTESLGDHVRQTSDRVVSFVATELRNRRLMKGLAVTADPSVGNEIPSDAMVGQMNREFARTLPTVFAEFAQIATLDLPNANAALQGIFDLASAKDEMGMPVATQVLPGSWASWDYLRRHDYLLDAVFRENASGLLGFEQKSNIELELLGRSLADMYTDAYENFLDSSINALSMAAETSPLADLNLKLAAGVPRKGLLKEAFSMEGVQLTPEERREFFLRGGVAEPKSGKTSFERLGGRRIGEHVMDIRQIEVAKREAEFEPTVAPWHPARWSAISDKELQRRKDRLELEARAQKLFKQMEQLKEKEEE